MQRHAPHGRLGQRRHVWLTESMKSSIFQWGVDPRSHRKDPKGVAWKPRPTTHRDLEGSVHPKRGFWSSRYRNHSQIYMRKSSRPLRKNGNELVLCGCKTLRETARCFDFGMAIPGPRRSGSRSAPRDGIPGPLPRTRHRRRCLPAWWDAGRGTRWSRV